MDKSFVSMEQHQCPACGKTHDTNALIIDKRLRDRFDKHTVTGISPCPECKAKLDEGFVILIGVDDSKTPRTGGVIKPNEAYRTGTMMYIKRELFVQCFNTAVPEKGIAFASQEVIDMLEQRAIADGALPAPGSVQ